MRDATGTLLGTAGIGMSLVAVLAPWVGAMAAAALGLGVTLVGAGMAAR